MEIWRNKYALAFLVGVWIDIMCLGCNLAVSPVPCDPFPLRVPATTFWAHSPREWGWGRVVQWQKSTKDTKVTQKIWSRFLTLKLYQSSSWAIKSRIAVPNASGNPNSLRTRTLTYSLLYPQSLEQSLAQRWPLIHTEQRKGRGLTSFQEPSPD